MNANVGAGAAASTATARDKEHPASWGWLMVQGVATLVLGTIGLYIANLVTLATVYVFAALMLAGGAFQIVHALIEKNRAWTHRLFNIVIGIIYGITAFIVFINPVAGSVALTIMVAALFMAVGLIRLYAAWKLYTSGSRWFWVALAGLINLVFGAFVAVTLPVSHFWVIGILVSVEMIMQGWLMVLVAWAARQAERESGAAAAQNGN
jgi:uncharacterized membrane protein HdeD (DUF308 family)